MLRVGLIGCGSIAKSHSRGWRSLSDKARVVAVSDIIEGKAWRVEYSGWRSRHA